VSEVRIYYGTKALPIFHDVIPISIRATMLFHDDDRKARLFTSWALAGGPLEVHAKLKRWNKQQLILIAKEAAAFAEFLPERDQREKTGQQVGAVLHALLALVGRNSSKASINAAIEVVKRTSRRYNLEPGKSSLHQYLSHFQPVLHLWGAWAMRIHDVGIGGATHSCWPNDTATADEFLEEAEIIRQRLTSWNSGQPHPSEYLNRKFISPYEGWYPRFRAEIPVIEIRPEDVIERKKSGRKSLSSE
jgi:hypothetical protein